MVLAHAEELPIPPDVEEDTPKDKPSATKSTRTVTSSKSTGGGSQTVEQKMAKWLKLGPSKWYTCEAQSLQR